MGSNPVNGEASASNAPGNPAAGMSVKDEDHVQVDTLDGFLQHLRAISSNRFIGYLHGLEQQNHQLKERIDRLNIAAFENMEAMGRSATLQMEEVKKTDEAYQKIQELKNHESAMQEAIKAAETRVSQKEEEVDGALKKNAELNSKVEGKDKELKDLAELLTKLNTRIQNDELVKKKLKSDRDASQKDLKAVSTELARWTKISVKLKNTTPDNIKSKLDRILAEARNVMETYMNADLPPEILTDKRFWEPLRETIPDLSLPASNSTTARSMRKVAFLHCLGSYLAQDVFTPFYGPESEMDSFWDTLVTLARQDASKEAHIRSLLLALFPEDQPMITSTLIGALVSDLRTLFEPLVLSEHRAAFDAALRDLCGLALREWVEIQGLEDKVIPIMEAEIQSSSHWKLLRTSSSPKSPLAQPHGAATEPQSVANGSSDVGADPVVCALWPCFLLIKGESESVLSKGCILPQSEMRAAAEELERERELDQNRLARQNNRRPRQPLEVARAPRRNFLGRRS